MSNKKTSRPLLEVEMDRTTDETDIIVEEYEDVIGNLNELSDRVKMKDTEAESIQEPTSIDRRNLTTHTGRPSLRSTNAMLAGSQEESSSSSSSSSISSSSSSSSTLFANNRQ